MYRNVKEILPVHVVSHSYLLFVDAVCDSVRDKRVQRWDV